MTNNQNSERGNGMEYTKRLATPEETKEAFDLHVWRYETSNPGSEPVDFSVKLKEAEEEGYKNEVCSCGNVFLAFQHFCLCRAEGCPFNCGKTVFEIMAGELEAKHD